MRGKLFIDTNILAYAYDRSNPNKQQIALSILDEHIVYENIYVSTQVLSEFFVTVTRKIPYPLSIDQAGDRIDVVCQTMNVLHVNEAIIIEAVRGVKTHHLSYWDSLIWATAKLNQLDSVISEDFSHNKVIEGIRFINPFQ